MYSPLLLAVFACLAGFYLNVPSFVSSDYWTRNLPECRNLKPCKMKTIHRNLSNQYERKTSLDKVCRCPLPKVCPSPWSNYTEHIVSIRLFNTYTYYVRRLMFCDSLQNLSLCQPNQTPLVMSGFVLPMYVDSINCRCRNSKVPLELKKRELKKYDLMAYDTYVCPHEMPRCRSPYTPCMTLIDTRTETGTDHHCKCRPRNGTQCKFPGNNGSYAYCRR